MACLKSYKYSVGILVVSDTVSKGEKVDLSGSNLSDVLKTEKYFPVCDIQTDCVSDDIEEIRHMLSTWADEKCLDLILTVGGTGFTPRDVTPEATKTIIDKEAPHLATYMILNCCVKTKFAALSRSACGVRNKSLILNLPGSQKGSQECFEVIAPILPHAMDQLKMNIDNVVSAHVEIQGSTRNERVCDKK